MKGILNVLKLAIKYGAIVGVVIEIVQFAVDKFSDLDVSKEAIKE